MFTLFYAWIFSFVQLIPAETNQPSDAGVFSFDYENVLGTSFTLKVSATDEQTAEQAEQLALDEIDRLDAILSTYKPNSEINRWQARPGIEQQVSPELFEVLGLFDNWKQKTFGALNPAVANMSVIWSNAEKEQLLPTVQSLSAAVDAAKQPLWKLNSKNQTAVKLTATPLVLNSFVKSYIIKKVTDRLMKQPGVSGLVVNIGGDMVMAGNRAETILITHPDISTENDEPVSTVVLQGKAIATSGNYRRGYKIGDQWLSHILDPRTGYPASQIISATVIADNPTDAGALATSFNILQLSEIRELASQMPGVEYLLVTADGKEIKSEGWQAFEIPAKGYTPFFTPAENRLTVELELASFEGRYRRPFVAIWLENKKKEPVKHLALWYNKTRWLPDLKRWYGKNFSILQDSVTRVSISSATRSAGKYTLSWNGLDDSGKPVPQGKYTLYIEAAREHGTYQIMKQEFDWNGKPAHFDLEDGVEISKASVTILK